MPYMVDSLYDLLLQYIVDNGTRLDICSSEPATVTATGITTTPTLGAPILTEEAEGNTALTAEGLAVLPVLGAPELAQIHALVAAGIIAGPELGTPLLDGPAPVVEEPPKRPGTAPSAFRRSSSWGLHPLPEELFFEKWPKR